MKSGKKSTRKTENEAPVQIDRGVNDQLQMWCDKHGRIKKDAVTKIAAWFLNQPESLQNIILSTMPRTMGAAYAAELERLAQLLRSESPSSPEDVEIS